VAKLVPVKDTVVQGKACKEVLRGGDFRGFNKYVS